MRKLQKKEETQLIQEWEKICHQEETLWPQKSRIRWCNTLFPPVL
jgi:hypothetical protein